MAGVPENSPLSNRLKVNQHHGLNGPFFDLNGAFPDFRPKGLFKNLPLEDPPENGPFRKGALRGASRLKPINV